MAAIKNVGATFSTTEGFLNYLSHVQFKAWKPRFVTVHHTGAPTLKQWQDWQTRKTPISDKQWLSNLAGYYGNTMKWSSGPHFFFTPNNFCVLSPPEAPGVHARSFNGMSWGVEMVGDFDREVWGGPYRQKYIDGLACLHMAVPSMDLEPFVIKKAGLHYHRDDPLTDKTCPGKKIDKAVMIDEIQAAMKRMGDDGDDHDDEVIVPPPATPQKRGRTKTPGDTLNVRADASQRSAIVKVLPDKTDVTVLGAAKNGATTWLKIDLPGDSDGYVSAQFVEMIN